MKNNGIARWFFIAVVSCMSLLFNGEALADFVQNKAELALLPRECYGTEQVRIISQDPVSKQEYMQMYGDSYLYFHHFCWALNSENNAERMTNRMLRDSKLSYAIGDLDFAIQRSSNDFVFMPEMLLAKARILSKLNRTAEALGVLNKLIEIKPDYVLAYRDMSNYYQKLGQKGKAVAALEDGLKVVPDSMLLQKYYHQLSGKEFVPPEKPAAAQEADAPEHSPVKLPLAVSAAPQQPVSDAAVKDSAKADEAKPKDAKPDPYCRFCP